jgi:ring-1,2-phenylacetyl-CoA epoxidase subunit PaaC
LINELPRGDFAFTMARQYLVDEFSMAFMQALCDSNDPILAGIAEKARKEARYHLRRSTDWMLRLGDGTPESHDRLQQAMTDIWGYTQEMFEVDALEERLIKAGIAVDVVALRQGWSARVSETLAQATIEQPRDDWSVSGGRRGVHTESLGHMLAELQFLQRAYPAQQW